ncbi:MAG: hypothetical protein RQ982_02605 [Gammaproteobacteria bacterium]|nr:hypothetical protein [Gammaproteobacteria bacterium]
MSQIVRAESKLYQYDGKLPFVEMMLNMMAVMGIIDRVPAGLVNRGYAGYGSGFPASGLSNPYMRALAMRGISPAAFSSLQNPYAQNLYGNSPFSRSPWLQSPWTQAGTSGISPLWGTPDWGVLPIDDYLNNSSWDDYGRYGRQDRIYNTTPYWSADDVSGWVNEPWEASVWNPEAKTSAQSEHKASQQSAPAVVQNFNYGVPANEVMNDRPMQNASEGNRSNNTAYNSSPLAKLAPPGVPPDPRYSQQRRPSPLARYGRPNSANQQGNIVSRRPVGKPTKKPVRQKPCVTEFCGLKKPDLDGLWVAQDGELLGIKDNRYLWADSNSRYLSGQLNIENEYLLANIDGLDKLLRFKYKLAGDHLLTMRPDGMIREFTRMSRDQYLRAYQDGYFRNGY